MILVDTSVWADHLRVTDAGLVDALNQGVVLGHAFVVGELACGNLKNREEILRLIGGLPAAPQATDDEAMRFIETHRLMGRGIGYIDVHLLASAALAAPARLWTRDRRLNEIAGELSLAL